MALNLQVKINNVDKKDQIVWNSLRIEDNINDTVNTCSFAVKLYGTKTVSVAMGDTVDILDSATKIFSGKVLSIDYSYAKLSKTIRVVCKDWTIELDRLLVTERYANMTVNNIIADIVANYTTGITTTAVNCTMIVKSIAFNSIPVSKAIQMLADQVNYYWYIDYNKDIHFFAKNSKNSESASFGLSDGAGNHIDDSFQYVEDNSQLKNRVIIRGGEKVGTVARSKNWIGDNSQTVFGTDSKFNAKPTVTVAGASKTVGIENLDQSGFDCYWNYTEKYIRFGTAPTLDQAVIFTGYPLIPIIVQNEDSLSVAQFGAFEFKKIDKSIKTTDEAGQYAMAQLEAYAKSLRNGKFRTYRSGLSSGQSISVNLAGIGLTDTFLIQRVTMQMFGKTEGVWEVEIVSSKFVGIITFLQNLILKDTKDIVLNDDEVLEKNYTVSEQINITELIALTTITQNNETVQIAEDIMVDPFGANTAPYFVLCPYVVTGQTDRNREFLLDGSYLS